MVSSWHPTPPSPCSLALAVRTRACGTPPSLSRLQQMWPKA